MAARRRRASGSPAGTLDLSRDPVAAVGRVILLIKVVLLVLIFDPAASDVFALPKASASRATDYLLAAVLVGMTLRYGRRLWRWSPLYGVAVAYLALNALAVPLALDRTLALYGAPTRLLGLTTVLDAGFTMLATAALIRTQADLRQLATVFLATAVPVFAYAWVQVVGRDPVRWSEARVMSTFGNPAHLGAYLAIVGSVALGMLVSSWERLAWGTRAGLAALVGASALTLGPVGSRAPVLALAIGSGLVLALAVRRLGRHRSPIAAVGVAALAMAGLALALSPVGDRFRALLAGGDPSREIIWSAALRTVAAHPVVGVGPDNFAAAYPAIRPLRAIEVAGVSFLESSPHSWLLQAAVSTGIPGVLVLVALTGYAVRRAIDLVNSVPAAIPLIGGFAAFLAQAVLAPDHIALDLIFWMAIGLVVSMEGVRQPGSDAGPAAHHGRGHGRPTGWRTADRLDAIAAGVFVLALTASTTTWSAVRAAEAHAAALGHADAGNVEEALRLGRLSVQMDSSRAQYWAGLGRAQIAAGQTAAALASFDRAASVAPYLAGHWRNVATTRLQLAQGKPELLAKALEAAERAVAAQPTDPFAHEVVGRVQLERGDRDAAIREAQAAIAIYANVPGAYQVIGISYAQLKRWDEAERILRDGIAVTDDLQLRLVLARILIVTDRISEAVPHLRYVLDRDPSYPEALELLRETR